MTRQNITRKEFIKMGGAALAFSSQLTPSSASTKKEATPVIRRSRPNILMIVTDQERAWNSLPKNIPLPRRRDFAARSTNFSRYHVSSPLCGPSRSVMYTGQHIQRTGVYDNPGRLLDGLSPKISTIGHMLQGAGYYTAYKGKWHISNLSPQAGTKGLHSYGFNEYQSAPDSFGLPQEGARSDHKLAGEAAGWLHSNAAKISAEQPWYLAVNLINPHDIMFFDATGQQNELRRVRLGKMRQAPDRAPYTDDLDWDLPSSFNDELSTKPQVHRVFKRDADDFYGPIPHDDEAAWRRYQTYYFNCLRDVDTEIGVVLDALEASGVGDNTIVIFTSDHGEMAGAHGQRSKGPFIYNENVGVPLVIRHPDISGGANTEALSSAVDLVPTILSLAGIASDAVTSRFPDLCGYDMSSVLEKPSSSGLRGEKRGAVLLNFSSVFSTNPDTRLQRVGGKKIAVEDFVQFEIRQFYRGFYDGHYRFARYFSPADHHRPENWAQLTGRNEIELYDLKQDPDAMHNLGTGADLHSNRTLIMTLNDRLNRLIDHEVGRDDGCYMPGSPDLWSCCYSLKQV